MSLHDLINQDLRLAMLRLLAMQRSYTATVSILHRGLTASREFHVPQDQVLSNAEWLRDCGLVQLEDLGKGCVSVTATQTGRAVAEGQTTRKGVTPFDPTQE